jgi:hypothetical protein
MAPAMVEVSAAVCVLGVWVSASVIREDAAIAIVRAIREWSRIKFVIAGNKS